jgi:hypothetical protein
MRSRLLLLFVFLALVACEDRFRYKCQDPQNWELAECKPPICTATATCPDQLIKPEQEKK